MRALLPLPALADNYIWFADLGGDHYLVVDPGEEGPVEAALRGRAVASLTILLTHHHRDHVGGATALRQRWRARVVAPVDPRIEAATDRVRDGDIVALPTRASARVIAVPGHTLSHVAYLIGETLFCGDTLFSLGCGRLFEGTPTQMSASLARLTALPPATRVCCGHEYTLANARFALTIEPDNAALVEHHAWATARREAGLPTLPSSIGLECAANPFLRCGTPAVRAAVANGDADADLDPVEVFARLRARKDRFAG
jgi:hydroxyacylglutathione hydrolase